MYKELDIFDGKILFPSEIESSHEFFIFIFAKTPHFLSAALPMFVNCPNISWVLFLTTEHQISALIRTSISSNIN